MSFSSPRKASEAQKNFVCALLETSQISGEYYDKILNNIENLLVHEANEIIDKLLKTKSK